MNYDFYLKNYSGKCVNIAVIDGGINGDIVSCKKHYVVNKDVKIMEINESRGVKDFHGTYCAQEIKKIANDATIYDFNVTDDNNSVTEAGMISALEYISTKNMGIDIISISMKLESFSERLVDVIKKLYDKGIFILASSDDMISYPADFEHVLAIQGKQCNEHNIIHINSKTICVEKKEYVYTVSAKKIVMESCSSLACAHYAGILALVIEGNILASFQQICDKLNIFNYEQKRVDRRVIKQNTVVIDSGHNIEWYKLHKQLLNKKIIGIYDIVTNKFVSLDNRILEGKSVENIIEINGEHYVKNMMSNQERFHKIPFQLLGKFDTNEKIIELKHFDEYNYDYIRYIKKPIIYIAGFVSGTQKYEVLIHLYEQLMMQSVNCAAMTCNPLGYVMGIATYEHPENITYPHIVYQLNAVMDENSYNDDVDILLVDIPGGITKLNWHNKYNFGMLFNAFLLAADADVVIIMLNRGIVWDSVKKEVEQIKLKNVPHIIFCISEFMFDSDTVESEQGLQLISNNEVDNENFYQEALKQLIGYKVFRYKELVDGSMVNYILSLYQ